VYISENWINVEWKTDSYINERGSRRMYIVTKKNYKTLHIGQYRELERPHTA